MHEYTAAISVSRHAVASHPGARTICRGGWPDKGTETARKLQPRPAARPQKQLAAAADGQLLAGNQPVPPVRGGGAPAAASSPPGSSNGCHAAGSRTAAVSAQHGARIEELLGAGRSPPSTTWSTRATGKKLPPAREQSPGAAGRALAASVDQAWAAGKKGPPAVRQLPAAGKRLQLPAATQAQGQAHEQVPQASTSEWRLAHLPPAPTLAVSKASVFSGAPPVAPRPLPPAEPEQAAEAAESSAAGT